MVGCIMKRCIFWYFKRRDQRCFRLSKARKTVWQVQWYWYVPYPTLPSAKKHSTALSSNAGCCVFQISSLTRGEEGLRWVEENNKRETTTLSVQPPFWWEEEWNMPQTTNNKRRVWPSGHTFLLSSLTDGHCWKRNGWPHHPLSLPFHINAFGTIWRLS